MRNKIALFGIMAFLVVLAVPATSAQLDYVNIGVPASEAGHNLYGWGPIEPAEHGGHWGGADDGTIRVTWYYDNGTGANCSVPCETPDPNGRMANFTMNNTGKNATILQLRVLDGHANDSFDVFIDDLKVYNYNWSGDSNEFWITHNIDISAFKDEDPLNISINSTGPKWSGWQTYGQLGVSWVKLVLASNLKITKAYVNWTENVGCDCTICYEITNVGKGLAAAGHNTSLFVNNTGKELEFVDVAIAPGFSSTRCFSQTYTPVSVIGLYADWNGTVDESDESNWYVDWLSGLTNSSWECGDVDNDGDVVIDDVRAVFNRYQSGDRNLHEWAADVDRDKGIDVDDARAVFARYQSGASLNCWC